MEERGGDERKWPRGKYRGAELKDSTRGEGLAVV
jgi:hypothetical protein